MLTIWKDYSLIYGNKNINNTGETERGKKENTLIRVVKSPGIEKEYKKL